MRMRPALSETAGTVWKRRARFGTLAFPLALGLALCACDYARMKDDEALRRYEVPMPQMPARSIPLGGGLEVLEHADPDTLRNPLPASAAVLEEGKAGYGRYCMQCHGPNADGKGIVGQSFAPLPTDLRLPYVQDQSDGLLFSRISLGYKRHPPLYQTVSGEDLWAIVRFIRSLGR
ncbi:MAG: c-type cytochrome [bacterium]